MFISDHSEANNKQHQAQMMVLRILSLPPKERELMKAIVEILTIQNQGLEFKVEAIYPRKGKKND